MRAALVPMKTWPMSGVIGKAYTALLDLKPGDNFEIKMGRKGFRLIPEGES